MAWWNFWNYASDRTDDALEQRRRRQAAAASALSNDELLPSTKERINRHRDSNMFTSDLSVSGFLQLKKARIEPVALVMGTSSLATGMPDIRCRWPLGEMPLLVQSTSNSASLALRRMRQEAALLGAAGVVGIRFELKQPDLAHSKATFTAFGTAVRSLDMPPSNNPFTSTLSAIEFSRLYSSGWTSSAVLTGCSAYYVDSDAQTVSQRRRSYIFRAPNQELVRYTKGCNDARRLAMARFQQALKTSGADGAIAIDTQIRIEELDFGDILILCTVIGTAIKEEYTAPEISALFCMDLQSRKKEAPLGFN